MEENFKATGFIEDWRFRYVNRWATDFHIEMLIRLGMITQREADYIKTGI